MQISASRIIVILNPDACIKTQSITVKTMSSLEPRKPPTIGPEKCNIVEVQGNVFKIIIMYILRDMNKSIKENVNKQ